MRLLERKNDDEFTFTKDIIDNIPRYAILSHTWGADTEEVTFRDLTDGTGKEKTGYSKIRFCGEQARHDGLRYFWVDTCCIDKSNNTELAEAINSMFRWYRNAAKCYVYLSDVPRDAPDTDDAFCQQPWESAFRKSRWFTRGWTLQELIAPKSVEFFSKYWEQLGSKASLRTIIHEITGIPDKALQGVPLSDFTIAERMSWAEQRETARKEDQAYSLLGIFDVHMPLIYGEGKEHAFKRLRGVINVHSSGKWTIPINGNLQRANILLDGSRLQREEAQACKAALFLTEPGDDRERIIHIKGPRVEGTCEWIKSSEVYQSWLHSRSQLLWLSGGPGKGKTMLSIFIAEELERIAKQSQDVIFVQYFCDNKDGKRNTAIAILRGLIYQLLSLQPKLFDHILPDFLIQREALFTGSSFEALWRIFESMVRDVLGTVYCVLDGLDECEEKSLETLLKKFKYLFSTTVSETSVCRLNLIAVSRDLPDFIPEALSSFPRIRLDPDAETEISSDILRFIKVKVDELSTYRRYPEPLYMRVKDVFLDRAKGTFLWVGIVAKELWKYTSSEVENALELFPPGLDELYNRMLLQIDDHRRETVAKILLWVVMAVRPLTLSELSAAIETDVRPSIGLSCDEVIRDQVAFCGHFLTIKYNEVSLIHQSAKDYLLRKSPDSNPNLKIFRIAEETGNLEIARKCLAYLQDGALTGGEVNLNCRYWAKDAAHLKAFPLLSYAALHWPEHTRSLTSSEDIVDLSYPFYDKRSLARDSWLKTYWAAKEYGSLPDPFPLLHLASYFGIVPLARNLLFEKGWVSRLKLYRTVNKRDGSSTTALHRAAENGHEAVVRLLLEKGADVKAKNKDGRTTLHETVIRGHDKVVRLLLEKGADIEAKDFNVALHQAITRGHDKVVRLLLEKGADVNTKDKDGRTALHQAVIEGNGEVVRLLLEKGADVEAKDKDGRTTLHKAIAIGQEEVVRLLLEKGADIEAKNKDGRTALHQAAFLWHDIVVRLLLEKGADVEAKNKDGRTTLHEAVTWGHGEVVRLLLEKGADIEAKDFNVALHQAAMRGHDKAVRLLLKKGAEIGAKDKDGRTTLHKAIAMGHEEVVRLLLEKGADVEAMDFRTALHQAATRGNGEVVRLLLEKGADVEAKDFNIALHQAATRGHDKVVRLLLEKGADVEAKNKDGRTTLYEAVTWGHDEVMRLLLEKGADVNARDKDGRTALHQAVIEGNREVVRLLLEKGADIEAKNKEERTALHQAVIEGNDEVVQLLLEKGADAEAKDKDGRTALYQAHQTVTRSQLQRQRNFSPKMNSDVFNQHIFEIVIEGDTGFWTVSSTSRTKFANLFLDD